MICVIVVLILTISTTCIAQGQVNYQYDASNRLKSVNYLKNGLIYTTTYTYDSNGNLMKANTVTDSNLLTNSGFENYTGTSGVADGWLKWLSASMTDGIQVVSSPVSAGSKAQKISSSSMPSGARALIYQDIAVDSNKAYIMNGRINVESLNNAKVVYNITFYDANQNYVGLNLVEFTATTNGYITKTSSGTTPANAARARIHVELDSTGTEASGTYYLDSINFMYSTEVNLLSNPGFENYIGTSGVSDGWLKWLSASMTDGIQVVSSPVSAGSKAQKISSSSMPSGARALIYQDIAVDSNKAYIMNGRINVESLNNAKVVYNITFYDANQNYVGLNLVEFTATTNGYITKTSSGTTPANAARARIHVELDSTGTEASGTYYLDSINFMYSTEVNLLSNASFENYTETNRVADGWQKLESSGITGQYTSSSDATEGLRSQLVEVNSLPYGHAAGISQLVAVEGGKSYKFQSQVKAESLNNAKVTHWLTYHDAAGNQIGGISTPQQTNSEYTTYTITGTTPANTVSMHVRLYLLNDYSPGTIGMGKMKIDMTQLTYTTETERLSNPGFETNGRTNGVADGWQKLESSGITGQYTSSSDATGGLRSQQVEVNSLPYGHAAGISQLVAVEGGKSYKFQSQVKAESLNNAKVTHWLTYHDAAGNQIGGISTPQQTNSEYTTYTITGTTPDNTVSMHVRLYLLNDYSLGTIGMGKMKIDMTQLTYTAETGRLSNASFENYTGINGVSDGWAKYVDTGANDGMQVVTSPVSSGIQAQKISSTNIPINGNAVGIVQNIQVDANKPYVISSRINIESLTNTKAQIYTLFYDANNQVVGSTDTEYAAVGAGYTTVSLNTITPANAAYARLYVLLRATGSGASGTFYVDNMIFQ